MLPALEATHPPAELLDALDERARPGADPLAIAAAAAHLLRDRLGASAVSVYRHEPGGGTLLLLARAESTPGGHVAGSRVGLSGGAVAAAVRTGEEQRAVTYVDPDFVRSLPGETRSEMAVPIAGPGGVAGVVHLEYTAPRQPDPRAGEVVRSLAPRLAAAMAMGAGEGGETADAATLAELVQMLARAEETDAAMQRLVDAAAAQGRCAGAVLLLRHPSRQMLEVAASAGALTLEVGQLVPLQGTLAGEVLRCGQVRAGTRTGSLPLLCERDAELGVSELLLAPVAAAGKVLGTLGLLNPAAPDPGAVAWLQGAAIAAGALETQRQIAALRQQISDGSTIAEVGRALTGTLGEDEVLGLVVRGAEMLAHAQGLALGLLNADAQTVHLASASGVLRRREGEAVPAHASLLGLAALGGEVLVTADISADPRGFFPDVQQGPAVAVPLDSRGRTLGVLLATRAAGAPEIADDDVDALRKLAAYAAIAIDNAQLYREQTELSERLGAQAAELERAYAELRESQERLLVSEKMAALGKLTAGIAHEINSPLGGIMNCLQLATQYAGEYQSSVGDPEVTAEDHAAIAKDLLEALSMAETATRKVGQFVRTIKGQTRMGDGEMRLAFDPATELNGTMSLLQHELRNRHVTLHVEAASGTTLHGDPGKFALVVQNLVTNAIDAYEGARGAVRVRLEERGGQAVLQVEDEGSGIPEAIRGRIFDYLFTTKDVGQGTGLGLSIVHSIVTTHFGGTIELQSEVGRGTTFVVTLPITADAN